MTYATHHGDCLEVMAGMPDASVDVILTDPPYSEHVHANVRSSKNSLPDADGFPCNTRRVQDLGFEHLSAETRRQAARHFARLAKRWVVVFCDIEGAGPWRASLEEAGLDYVRTGIWVKPGAAPQFSGDRPGVGYEGIVIAHPRGRKRWNGGGRHAVWEHPIVLNRSGDSPRLHTAEKPVALMRELVALFSDAAETVMDPFMGSGTTGVAALMEGRRFIGVELDADHFATADKRLRAAAAQPRLLEAV